MWKEIIICIVIILMIFLGNYITQKYTTQSVTNLNDQLKELEEKIQTSENDIIVSQMNELKIIGMKDIKIYHFLLNMTN